jgi:hypothetical protein
MSFDQCEAPIKKSESEDSSVVRSESGKIERRNERSTLDSAGESSLRGRVISPVGRMSQHVFLMILNKTLMHSKEILVFGVRGDLENHEPGIFCRSQCISAIVAGRGPCVTCLCCRIQILSWNQSINVAGLTPFDQTRFSNADCFCSSRTLLKKDSSF